MSALPISQSPPHESAHLHVTGEATYIDDVPERQGTLHAALGLSHKAYARLKNVDLETVRCADDVVAVLTAQDIPGANRCGPIVDDEPILADEKVCYRGQPIFVVIAKNRDAARRAARLAHIDYEELPAQLSIQKAYQQASYVIPPLRLKKSRSGMELSQKIATAPHRLSGHFSVGGQEHFYLEGQVSYALPKESQAIHLYCSTQHPSEMQHVVARALNLSLHQVVVEMRRMGGGFGGKESQSAIFAAIACIAARHLNCPVKLRLDRDDDMMITGKRHDCEYQFDVGYDDEGVIHGVKIEILARAGFSADLSGPVLTRAVCHVDNTYYLSDVDITAYGVHTHTQSNTAFRGFGAPQGALVIEHIVDSIARCLNKDALEVRRNNFYGIDTRNITPYDQKVEDNIIVPLVDELTLSSNYEKRKQATRQFNDTSPILKKGMALTPVKFGISFNVKHFNQAGALVHIYVDGSIMVTHGGTEMGQGLNTKVAQVVAHVLGVTIDLVKTTAADTSKIPNTSATAASTGADLNGKAAEEAARKLRTRLATFMVEQYGGSLDEVQFSNNSIVVGDQCFKFSTICRLAYEARIQLWADGFYTTPKIHWDRENVCGSPFYYFAYGAAVSEVMVDTLTGEWKLLQTDLLHDAGRSLNEAIDIGQIEGGYIQGVGWLTTEELYWNQEGRLMTHAPSTYKIPAIHDVPAQFYTKLFANINREETVFRSKAVGEPPLLLGFSVFYAIRDALASLADYRINPPLNAPATPESILKAIEALLDD